MTTRVFNIESKAFILLVFIASCLPTGTLLGIPVKHIVFVLLAVVLACKASFTRRPIPGPKFKFCLYLAVVTALFAYLCYAFWVSNASPGLILKDFQFIFTMLVFFIFLEITKVVADLSWREMLNLLATSAFWGATVFATSKTLVIFSLLIGIIDFPFVENVIFKAINYEPVGLAIELIGSRFSFVSIDLLTTIVFALVLYKKDYFNISRKSLYFFYLVFAVSIFSAYSRLLFGLIGLFFYCAALLNREYKKVLLVTLAAALLVCLNFELFQQIFNNRFLNQGHSDSHRLAMFRTLTSNWADFPVLGSGFGSFAPGYVRSQDLAFSYEMQLLSVVMRFGLPSLFAVLAVELLYAIALFKTRSRDLLFAFLVLNTVLIASMTNQYLFSSQSSVIFMLVYAISMSVVSEYASSLKVHHEGGLKGYESDQK